MKCHIIEREEGLEITVHDAGPNAGKLLEAFGVCQERKCECSATQREKLASIDVASHRNSVVLTLKPKEGETLDRDEIEDCPDFTLSAVN
ncbi:MAG: hypothetical protein V3U24_06310 [Candidatus Neomarinimicrobiota bacterium]